jgi:predicted glycoside hydrolase/deacetylase ChbG (UPF0249 family)
VGLLIISADDWGSDRQTTDAIHECFSAGAVSSVSAMVFMSDSARSAEVATLGGEPVGLHLNLTEAFGDPACPEVVRRRQERIVGYFGGPKWRSWGFSPTRFREIEDCIADQLEAFKEIYGRDPTHVDGHQHVHQSLGVMFSRSLPHAIKMRPSFTFMPGEKSLPNRLTRRLFNLIMRSRFSCPRYFFDIRDIHPELGGAGLETRLDLANQETVEVMTHPGLADERAVLLGDSWNPLLSGRPVGAYTDLAP